MMRQVLASCLCERARKVSSKLYGKVSKQTSWKKKKKRKKRKKKMNNNDNNNSNKKIRVFSQWVIAL
jgi:hypothetical protein